MKKIGIYLVSTFLMVSMILPFTTIEKASATAISEVTTEQVRGVQLSSNGKDSITIQKEKKETTFEITINKEIEAEESKIQLNLPSGVKYVSEETDKYQYDEKKNELVINQTEMDEELIVPLVIQTAKVRDDSLEIMAELQSLENKVSSNLLKIDVIDTAQTEGIIMAKPVNDNPLTAVNKVVKSSASPANVKGTKVERTTTVPGIPAAPIPDEITTANGASNEVNATTWKQFDNAMRNSNINVIHVQADFYNSNNETQMDNVAIAMRPIKINGNGHVIDFRGISYYNNSTLGTNRVVQWEINHLTMYGRNYYGPIKTDSSANASGAYGAMVYKNITYIGSQLTASYKWTIDFEGMIENHSRNNYISPFDNKSRTNQANQVNIEAKDVLVRENAYYNGTTENAGVFRLENSGQMTLEDNADMTMSSGGSTGEYSTNVLYLQGKVVTGKNAKLSLNASSSGNQRAIEIVGSGNGIVANQNSEIHINTIGGNAAYDVISMGAYTSIEIDDGADLIINAKNKGSGTGDLIAAGTRTNFLIGEKATFSAISDGSSNHAILNFGSNSRFQFADAEQVNLQFTNNSLSSAARLIKLTSGNLDVDVQDVKAWNRANNATNSTRDADFHWTPMFGMVTSFTNTSGTVLSASSVMNEMRELYRKEFIPQNFSRLLYSYIEDVEIGILNKPNDNIDSIDSQTIRGVTNPGAYVRLTGDEALPTPEIPSIVNGSDNQELTANYTVIADDSGNFTVHAKAGEHFKTPNSIKAYAFLGGKMDAQTVKILDRTAPDGEGIQLAMIYDDQLPNAEKFIKNPTDTNPENTHYTYEFKQDYTALAQQEGTHDVVILLGDAAGNKKEITAKLEVMKNAYTVEADDISVPLSKVKTYVTAEAMDDFLLTDSKAKAKGIVDNKIVDLTRHLVVQEKNNIDQMKVGKYKVTIGFDLGVSNPTAKASKEITVTVLNDEAVKPTNPENPGEGNEPDEKENPGTGQTGLLKLDYAPSNFNFGEVAYGFNSVKTNAVKTASSKQWLQVSDHRTEEEITSWSVQVFENHELASIDGEKLKGATITIPKGKLYNEETGHVELATGPLTAQAIEIDRSPATVFSADNTMNKLKNISTNVWNATDVSLIIPGNQEVGFKEYSNTITWSLVAEPTE